MCKKGLRTLARNVMLAFVFLRLEARVPKSQPSVTRTVIHYRNNGNGLANALASDCLWVVRDEIQTQRRSCCLRQNRVRGVAVRLPFLFLAATLCNAALAAESREVYYQGFLVPQSIVPTFDKGYLLVYNFEKIDVYAPDGSPLYSVSAEVPNAKIANIQNAATDVDGTMAGAVYYARERARGGGIVLFDRSGKQTRFFDTGKYWPTQVCFAPDHTIWTLGWQGPETSGPHDDYFVLRNYSQDGQELGAFLPRSTFEPESDPVGPMIGGWRLRIMNNRIGAVFYGGMILGPRHKSRPMQWIEVDLKGKLLGRWEVGAEWPPEAFTQSGALYTHSGDAVLVFDRSTKAWRPVAGTPAGFLLGADGNSLVFEVRGTSRLRWVPASQ